MNNSEFFLHGSMPIRKVEVVRRILGSLIMANKSSMKRGVGEINIVFEIKDGCLSC